MPGCAWPGPGTGGLTVRCACGCAVIDCLCRDCARGVAVGLVMPWSVLVPVSMTVTV